MTIDRASKLEVSAVWTAPHRSGRAVRAEETAALVREQQLHIEAAARQLDTLAQLERRD
jgi:hypothetical protein